MKFNSTIQQKYGTSREWNKENPTLLEGEIAVINDYGETLMKVGDGITSFVDLEYVTMPIPEDLHTKSVFVADTWSSSEAAVVELLPGQIGVYNLNEHGPIDEVYLTPGSIQLRGSEVVTFKDLEEMGLFGSSDSYCEETSDMYYDSSDSYISNVIEIDYDNPLQIVSGSDSYYMFTSDCLYTNASIYTDALIVTKGSDVALCADHNSVSVDVDFFVKGKTIEQYVQEAIKPLVKEIERLKDELAKK